MNTLLTSRRTRKTPAGAVVRDHEVRLIPLSECDSSNVDMLHCPLTVTRIVDQPAVRIFETHEHYPPQTARFIAAWQRFKNWASGLKRLKMLQRGVLKISLIFHHASM